MKIGVPKEATAGDRRVALVPDAAAMLIKNGMEVLIESGAGTGAEYLDESYREKGAKILAGRDEVFAQADVILQINLLGMTPDTQKAELSRLRKDQTAIGFLDPLGNPQLCEDLAARGVTSFAFDLLPRITRAQSMDSLSSMAMVAGYKAVLIAAEALPRFFPMFMTAAGTISPAKVFVIGAGVAGLQAIATAKRLGAVVYAYDIRPAVKQEVESLGGKFVELPLETASTADSGGYARAMDEAFYTKQRELMHSVISKSDVVITTASVPGKKAPVLVTKSMVEAMAPGSVVVDLAAEQGGNCELTKPGERVVHKAVTVIGPINVPSTVPYHASQMYARNVVTFLMNCCKSGKMELNLDDEIVRETLITRNGDVVHPRVRERLGKPPLPIVERKEN
ncbi:Re/Si-specific NAD(P)(+) transhydrogenase subunit alpha [candidate division KSB1 bacterium]|nr:MAG: Re/Si-specific NAD(P)(+) transhydrogenase subunit alpha [candidate division KSB1 bacterium]